MSGSRDTAKIAGTESTAKMMSLISRNSSATSSGVACQRLAEIDEESWTVQVPRHRHQPAEEANHGISLRRDLVMGRPEQLDAGQQQEHPEQQDDDVVLHEDGANADEHRAEDERPKDAVEEHAVLIDRRDGEVVEDQHEDEDVVDRE